MINRIADVLEPDVRSASVVSLELPHLDGALIAKYSLIGAALVVLSDIPVAWPLPFFIAQGILGLLLFSTFLMPVTRGVLLFFMILVAGQDIVSAIDPEVAYATASVWQMRLGPVNPSWIVFFCGAIHLLRLENRYFPLPVKRAILWFSTVPFAAGLIYGGLYSYDAVVDIKLPLMLLVSAILFVSLFRRDPQYLSQTLAAFIGVLLARHSMDLVYFLSNVGPAIAEGVSRGSDDSAKGAAAFLAFFGLTVIWAQRRVAIGSVIAAASVLLIAAYATRYLWITFAAGVVLLMFLLELRRYLLFLSIAAAASFGALWTLSTLSPSSAEVLLGRLKDITEGRPIEVFAVQVNYNAISRIDQVRYAEIVNVIDSVSRRYAVLWGTGYGGYYEDAPLEFRQELIGPSAFPIESFETGRFASTHEFASQMFLKYGLVGLLCIMSLWLTPCWAVIKSWRRIDVNKTGGPQLFAAVVVSLVAFVPTAMLEMYWSGKGLFLNGMIIACYFEAARYMSLLRKVASIANPRQLRLVNG